MSDAESSRKPKLPRPTKRPLQSGALPRPRKNGASDTGTHDVTQSDEIGTGQAPALQQQTPASGLPKRSPAPRPSMDRYEATVTSESRSAVEAKSGDPGSGRYEVIRPIARGGMGEVFLGIDHKLNGRFVALKRLTEEALLNPKLRQRFEAEAGSMARLTHPHVIRVFDVGSDELGPFICMEYVAGPPRNVEGWNDQLPAPPMTMQEYVEMHGPMTPSGALGQMQRLCSAVTEAHRLGIIHRDIKPANVLLDANLHPRLIDFGLARETQPQETQHTVAGASMLTIGYGAPEQESDASQADERADVYALGGVLWFLVSGQNPRFYRNTDAPEELRAVLAGALARDREHRIQSVQELDEALNGVRGRSDIGHRGKASGQRPVSQLSGLSRCLEQERRAGVCPFCSHVHEPIPKSAKDRQFCAGCGTTLWLTCRSCRSASSAISLRRTRLTPLWERFCSKCGDDLLGPVLEHVNAAVSAIEQAQAVVADDTEKAHELAASARESLDCLSRRCGADFSVGRVGEICSAVVQEIESICTDASRVAATNEEDAWKQALEANDREAFEGYLKKWPTGLHAAEAEERLNVMALAADIRDRLQQKAYETLLPDVGRLMQMSTAARQRWSDEKLSQLLKRDHSFDSCLAYLQVYPEGRSAAQAKSVVSPVLRKKLMKALRNQDLRQEYLAFRADSQQEEDEGRAFNSAIWLWSVLGAAIAVPAIIYGGLNNEQQLVIGGIITLGVGILIGVLKAVLSGRHATFGPLPVVHYMLPSFAVPSTFRPQKVKTSPSTAPDSSAPEA